MVKRVASGLLKSLIALAVMLLVIIAVLVGVARQFVYEIDDFQTDVATFFSRQTGLLIEFDRLTGSWKGLAPRFLLSDVRLRQRADAIPAVVARQVDLEVLLLPSLLHLQPRVRLSLEGLALTLVYRDGRLGIEGLEPPAPAADARPFDFRDLADLVASQPRLMLADSQLQLKGLYHQDVTLSVQQFQVESAQSIRGKRYASGRITLQGPSDLAFDLRAQVRGSLLDPASLNGDLYLEAAHADWLPWIPDEQRQFKTVSLESLWGGGKIWLKLGNGMPVDVTSRFQLQDFTLRSQNEVQPPLVKFLSGLMRWQQDGRGGWQVGVEDLRMVTPRFTWQPSMLSAAASVQGADAMRYTLGLDDADITPWLHYYLALQPEDDKLYQTLKALRPAGKLRHFALMLQRQGEQINDYRFAAKVEQFNSRAWEKFPGLRDLDIKFWGERDLLLAKLEDDYLELNYPWLFRDTLVLTQALGTLALSRSDDGFNLQSSLLQINTDDMRSATQFALQLPADKSLPPFMQLQSTLRDIDATKKSLYLPAGIIPPNLLKWLDDGILSGRLLRGDIVVHGALGKEWVEDRNVLLGFTVADAALQFLPDWKEPVTGIDADVIVDNGAVQADAVRGEYFQQAVQGAQVTMSRIRPGSQPILNVAAQTVGNADSGFAVLQKTPLAERVGEIVQDMSLQGDLEVDLKLAIPLAQGEQTTAVDVNVGLQDGTFNLASQKLSVTGLNTTAHFDLVNGLSAKGLKGQTLGGPVTGSIVTRAVPQGGQSVQMKFNGNAQVTALQQWLQLSVLAPLAGELDYALEMQIPTGAAKQHKHGFLNITSKLRGTTVNLPQPFGKTAKGSRDFRVWQSINREPSLLSVRYADLFELSLQKQQGKLQKGVLSLGEEKARLPGGNYFSVEGVLHRLDTAEWQPVLDQITRTSQQLQEDIAVSRAALLDHSSLRIDEMIVGGTMLGAIQVDLEQQPGLWQVQLRGDRLAGTARIPTYIINGPASFMAQTTVASIDLDYLRLPKPPEADPPPVETPIWVPSKLSPLQLPSTDILIQDLQLGDGSFGRWNINLRRTDRGMRIENINAQVRSIELKASGDWHDDNGARTVTAQGEFRSRDIADVMRAWGSEPTISSKDMRGKFNLNWPGAPFEFSLLRARGNLDIAVEDGSFYNVKSGVAGKFWGALNFETLLRRLQLNFKDLSEKDMVYDQISANAQLDSGVLRVKDLELDSPSIKLQTAGDINLHASELDLVMRVTVPVTRNLVLPAAAIGGVPAAATVYVIEKMLGDQFDKLTTIKYSVKGHFDDPKVAVMNSFNIIPRQVSETVIGGGKDEGKITLPEPPLQETAP